ncbi:hypothetical protein E3Q05_04382 [Wallemia mellicola]|nr:hypothetical protein E3Q05_04382 [Wallemia mellicola]
MSDDEVDFMDDAFLTQAAEFEKKESKGKHQTYGEMRLQAIKDSEDKNLAGRIASKKQREREKIEEGLERNIIEEAAIDDNPVEGSSNKALNMMMKMGFKPGQSLGKRTNDDNDDKVDQSNKSIKVDKKTISEPVKPYFLQGRSGIGVQRIVSSKEISEAAAASNALNENQQDFRLRKTYEANARKSEGILKQLRTTIKNADEDLEIKFNVFWINPYDIETYPPFILSEDVQPVQHIYDKQSEAQRLKEQMQNEKLRDEYIDGDEYNDKSIQNIDDVDPEVVQQCKDFLKLDVSRRSYHDLSLITIIANYSIEIHSRICQKSALLFGTKYDSKDDMNENCPGFDEDDH